MSIQGMVSDCAEIQITHRSAEFEFCQEFSISEYLGFNNFLLPNNTDGKE